MPAVLASLLLALRQLFDGRVLAVLLKSVAVSLALFALLAAGLWYGVDWALASGGLADRLFAGAGAVREALSLLLALLGLWLLWRIVAMAVIQFFADDVVLAVEARHYPAAGALAVDPPIRLQLTKALRGAGRALLFNLLALPVALALLVTGVGTAIVFLLVNAILLGRELQDMVWIRHAGAQVGGPPVGAGQRFALGFVIAALLALPFVNFLAPVLGAGAATHLVHRNMMKRNVA